MNAARPLYSERTDGRAPRVHDELPDQTREALLLLVKARIDDGSLAEEFPLRCQEYGYAYGTDEDAFATRARAEIRGLDWPVRRNVDAPDAVIFDLLEYVGGYVQKPVKGEYHSWFRHHSLRFQRSPGRAGFRAEVNRLLERGGTTFEMDETLQIIRSGTVEVQEALDLLRPDTGDDELDELIHDARHLFQSRSSAERKRAIDTLWDAFERLKSIDVPGARTKKQSMNVLLDGVPTGDLRDIVEAEMKALTGIGNSFRIRHHEADKHDVPADAYDYLFIRLSATMRVLLQYSDRLGDSD